MGYKAIICDDDEMILKGLQKLIPWEELGIDLMGAGFNGKDAMALIDEHDPDIVISDIRMPFVDGLELIQYAKGKNQDIKVIFVSGYDDFKYAQQAVKHGAMDYILKPIDEEALVASLKVAVTECDQLAETKNISSAHQQFLEEDLINTILYEGEEPFLAKAPQNILGEDFLDHYSQVMLIEIDGYSQLSLQMSDKEINDLYKFLIRTCRNMENSHIGSFKYRPGSVGIYFINDQKKKIKEDRSWVIESVTDQLLKFFPERGVSFSGGTIYSGVTKLYDSFYEAGIVQKERFLFPVGAYVAYKDLEKRVPKQGDKGIESILVEMDFVTLIKQGDMRAVEAKLVDLKDMLNEIGGKSYLYMTMVIANLYMNLLKELKQLGIEEDGFSLDLIQDFQMVTGSVSVDDVVENLRKSLKIVLDYMSQNSSRYAKVISKAKTYIQGRFDDHQLSIEEVADHVHMSASYFGVIFRNELEISFTDYLIQLRLEKAKELILTSDKKISEISDAVGYDTAAYFSTSFKKHVGMSPSEYKRKHL